MRLLARDASFYEAICRGETVLPLTMERRLNACGTHLGSPNFFSSLGVHIYLGRGLSAEDETTAAPKLEILANSAQRMYQSSAKSRVALPRPLTS